MDPPSARYLIRIKGHLGDTLLSAFPAMACQRQGTETVLTGMLDQPGLHGVLAEIGALGLDLLELRRLTPGADGRKAVIPGGDPSPVRRQPVLDGLDDARPQRSHADDGVDRPDVDRPLD
jgi:hypothetical protein